MIKKIVFIFSMLIIISFSYDIVFADPVTDTSGKWEYNELENGTVTIHNYLGMEKELILPSKIDGKNVKGIENGAFISAINLSQINIPENITNIEEGAFYGCMSLKNFVVSSKNPNYSSSNGILMSKDETKIICYPANRVGTFTVPDKVVYIADKAFSYSRLSVVNISSNVNYMGEYAFMFCSNLLSIEIPGSLKTINEGAFACCGSLEYVKISAGVEEIKEYAFLAEKGMSKLKTVIMPTTVKSIGEFVFENCDKFKIYGLEGSYGKEYAEYKGINCQLSKLQAENVELVNSSYTYNGEIKRPKVRVEFEGNVLKENIDYKIIYNNNINPGKASVEIVGVGVFTGNVKKDFVIKPSVVTGLKQNTGAYGTKEITAIWNKSVGVDGYELYRANKKNGNYTLVARITTIGYKNKKLSAGKNYFYKVRGYKLIDGKRVYGEYSSVVEMITKTDKPNIKVKPGKKQAKITWRKVAGANGYEVYMSTSKKGKYKKIKTVKANKTSYTKKKLKKGKKCYFKMRNYRIVDSKKVYSAWSKVISVKVR